jgi:hypothetical protein
MLGVQRSSVTMVARKLQEAGVIRYRRGHIQVLDIEGLQATPYLDRTSPAGSHQLCLAHPAAQEGSAPLFRMAADGLHFCGAVCCVSNKLTDLFPKAGRFKRGNLSAIHPSRSPFSVLIASFEKRLFSVPVWGVGCRCPCARFFLSLGGSIGKGR